MFNKIFIKEYYCKIILSVQLLFVPSFFFIVKVAVLINTCLHCPHPQHSAQWVSTPWHSANTFQAQCSYLCTFRLSALPDSVLTSVYSQAHWPSGAFSPRHAI